MRTFFLLVFASVVSAFASAQVTSDNINSESTSELVQTSDVKWGPLNPARGDKGPKAGTLWGDRTGAGPSGFLVKFLDGFSSPPHIHNITYRGVVISGLLHNDDPKAENMWLPAGSFWTQPAGEVHITAAEGSNNLAYIEIENGPYLVLPTEEKFDNGEKPVNIDKSNIVWLDASNITWINQAGTPNSTNGPEVAFLWGSPQENQLNGSLIKLPAGFTGSIHSYGSIFRAVVIQGQPQYQVPSENDVKTLESGNYFGSKGEFIHEISSKAGKESIIYVRTNGKFDVVSAQPKK